MHPAADEEVRDGGNTPQELDTGNRLETIPEGENEDDIDDEDLLIFYQELMSDEPLEEDDTYLEIPPCPVEIIPENTFLVACSDGNEHGSMHSHGNEHGNMHPPPYRRDLLKV